MARKLPLIPTWLVLFAVFGTPFLRSFFQGRGFSPERSSNLAFYCCVVLAIAAFGSLWILRDQLPARPKKPKRRWFGLRAAKSPAVDAGEPPSASS